MRSRVRKSKRKLRQKQRQRTSIKIHMPITVTSGGGAGGGSAPVPWYRPGQPTVGEAHLPNQAALVPNRPAAAVMEDLRSGMAAPDHQIISPGPLIEQRNEAMEIAVPPSRVPAKGLSAASQRSEPIIESKRTDAIPPLRGPPVVGDTPVTPGGASLMEAEESAPTPPITPASGFGRIRRAVAFLSPEKTPQSGPAEEAPGPPATAGRVKFSPGIPVSLGTRFIKKRRGAVGGK